MITLKEIAAEAGVSMTTVSNVLHGKAKKVSPEVEERIKKLLVKYNYILRFGLNALTNKDSKSSVFLSIRRISWSGPLTNVPFTEISLVSLKAC